MNKVVHRAEDRGKSELGWLSSRFSFSFSNYHNPKRTGFGKLLVLNDDVIAPGKGFGTHPHENMEIITLVTKGELEHKDSLDNIGVVKEGEMQVMSAGRGIHHSEYNHSKTKPLELFQIWIETARLEITPRHETKTIKIKDNILTAVVSGNKKDNILFINQDAKIYLGKFGEDKEINYNLDNGRGLFIFAIEGSAIVEDETLSRRDSIEITNTSKVKVVAEKGSYLIIVDVSL